MVATEVASFSSLSDGALPSKKNGQWQRAGIPLVGGGGEGLLAVHFDGEEDEDEES